MSMFDLTIFSAEEISALSGRICAPGIPPKSKSEAKQHIQLIRQLMDHERSLLEEEAKETRERRETADKCLRHWRDVVLPDFEQQVHSKQTLSLWTRYGIPNELRGAVWGRIVANERHISSHLFELCVEKARHRERSSTGSKAPSESQGPSARTRREDDPSFFSPKLSKIESMLSMQLDLPRTIISRALAPSPAPSSSTASPRASPLQSPRARVPPSAACGAPASDEWATRSSPGGDSSSNRSFTTALPSLANVAVDGSGSGGNPKPPSTTSPQPAAASGGAQAPTTMPTTGGGLASSDTLINSMCDDVLIARVRKTLCAYIEYRPDIGYVQGMTFLAAMILLHIHDDEQGFIVLANLMNRGHFRLFYSVHNHGIAAYISAYDECLRRCMPALYGNFMAIGVNAQMYVMNWWMALFSRALPYETAARCWDLYLLDEVYLFRITIAIFVYFSAHVHEESQLDEVMMFLSKIQRQHVDDRRFFAIVNDDVQCGGSLQMLRDVLHERLRDVPPLDDRLEL